MSQALRKLLQDLLGECTEKQQAFFWRCQPYGTIDKIPEERIVGAIKLCERTIEKNEGK